MSSYSSAVVERIRNNLFATQKEMEDNRLSEFEQTRILRLRDMYNHWIAYPTTRERDITEEILRRWPDVDRDTALRYVQVLRVLLGDLGKTNKDYIRWRFNEMIMDAYYMAARDHNPDAMIKALDKFAKYNQLDKADVLDNHWETIKPQTFIMTDDPSVIGFKPIPNIREKIAAKIHQYWNEQVEDVRFVEMPEATKHIGDE